MAITDRPTDHTNKNVNIANACSLIGKRILFVGIGFYDYEDAIRRRLNISALALIISCSNLGGTSRTHEADWIDLGIELDASRDRINDTSRTDRANEIRLCIRN